MPARNAARFIAAAIDSVLRQDGIELELIVVDDASDDGTAAVVETIRPIQARYAELSADPAETMRLLAQGADKARAIASKVYTRARDHIGLLPRA